MSIYNKKFSRLMAHFVPEFGNTTHVQVCKLLTKLSKLDIRLEKKMSEARGIKKMNEEMKTIIK